MNQDTAKPTAKVATGGAAGALTVLLVFAAGWAGVEVPAEVAAAATVLISFVAGYFKRDGDGGRHAAH